MLFSLSVCSLSLASKKSGWGCKTPHHLPTWIDVGELPLVCDAPCWVSQVNRLCVAHNNSCWTKKHEEGRIEIYLFKLLAECAFSLKFEIKPTTLTKNINNKNILIGCVCVCMTRGTWKNEIPSVSVCKMCDVSVCTVFTLKVFFWIHKEAKWGECVLMIWIPQTNIVVMCALKCEKKTLNW